MVQERASSCSLTGLPSAQGRNIAITKKKKKKKKKENVTHKVTRAKAPIFFFALLMLCFFSIYKFPG